jgi:uncharacterized protein (TIGR02271 family)
MTEPARVPLPIEAQPVLAQDGWSVRLPVRAEEITISKQTVIRERVLVKRTRAQDFARVDAVLRREELRTSRSGPVEVHEQVSQKPPGS